MSAKIAILFVVTLWWGLVYSSLSECINNDSRELDRKYEPVFIGNLLPIALFIGFVLDIIADGFELSLVTFMNNCANLIFIISVYYLFVFLLLKLFRKHFHPLAVSTIWILPNLLYFFVVNRNEMLRTNSYILVIPNIIMYSLIGIWVVGFIGVVCFKMKEHFNYRKSILEGAIEITNQNIIDLFENEKKKTRYKKEIKLMKSNHVHTPLTIGIRNQVLVLPNINYTEEELKLILRHEMIHIGRNDVLTKFHLVFCNALCWFNPLMWLANKKCSEDLELSCDTSVLANEDSVSRKQYARLILKNVNSEKGFTTCLSADAKSLQYRLENVIQPKKTKKGGLIILLFITLLLASWGRIGIAIQGYNGSSELFEMKNVELTEIERMNVEFENQVYSLENGDKIIEYFSNLEVSKLSRTSLLEDDKGKQVWFYFEHDSGFIRVMVYDHYIKVDSDYVKARDRYYYVKDGIDWAYLDELILEYPALKLSMTYDGVDFGGYVLPTLSQVSKNGEVIYESSKDSSYENFSHGYPTEFKIEFYDEVVSDIEISEKTVNGTKTYSIDKDDQSLIQMPKKDVSYTIKAMVKKNQQVYEVVYTFDQDYYEE